jgi:hypothetical protein
MAKYKVYQMLQADKVRGKWNKKKSRIEQQGVKLSDDYVKLLNSNFAVSGRYYEVDAKSTDAYLASIKKDK